MMFVCPLCHQDTSLTIEKEGPIEEARCQCQKCKQFLPPNAVSAFMKQTLRGQKQYITTKKSGFQITCKKCNRPVEGILNKAGTAAVCSVCGSDLETTPFMLNALRSLGKREKT
jgi:hypothetical protein